MKKLKENKPLRYTLGIVFFIFLCCNLPSLALCLAQDVFRPPNTEVLVSACKRPVATGVPGGEVLFVHEVRTSKMYLLDLRTGEKRKVPNDPLLLDKGIFLSSDLVWLWGSYGNPDRRNDYRPHYVLDLTNGKRYELLDLNELSLKDGRFDPKYYEYLKSADRIFLNNRWQSVIGLSSDISQGGNIIFRKSSLETEESGERLKNLLEELGVDYQAIDFSHHTGIPSPTNKYVIRNDGIYFSGTDFSIVNREYTGGYFMGGYFKGWYYDESAVVVQEDSTYLFSNPLGPRFFLIPRPILKLNLP